MAHAPFPGVVTLLALVIFAGLALNAGSTCAQGEKPLSREEIDELVGQLVTPEHRYESVARLRAVGKRATPALVALLNDPQRAGAIQNPKGYRRAYLDNVVAVLSLDHVPEVVEPLAKYLDHEDFMVRAAAAQGLARVAAKECVGPVLKALTDSHDTVVAGPITGLKWAIDDKKTSPEFLAAVFPGFEKLIRDSKRKPNRYLAELMVAIDPERSARVFESDDVLRVGGPQTGFALSAINKSGMKLDREKLLKFIAAIRPLVTDDANDFEYCMALEAYGVNPDANTEALLRAEVKSKHKMVALGAADGLAALAGVFNANEFVIDRFRKVGFDGLTPVQRHFFVSQSCYNGFRYLFENESGNQWKEIMEGLDALGAVEQAKLYRQAVALFEPEKPGADDAKRRDQMDKFTPEKLKKLDELSEAYEKCEPQIGVLMSLYAAAHPKEFRD